MMSIIRFVAAGAIATLVAGFAAGAASADNNNTQTAANLAETTQVATAISGDAAATNTSTATSGGAVATSYLATVQAVVQRATNTSVTCDCTNTNSQDGTNAMLKAQQATAVSGIASADLGSDSATGAVAAILEEIEQQLIDQLSNNDLSAPPVEEEPPVEE